jgi:hypothetical protein
VTFAPTCFGSRRNHHQGAVLCLAKTTTVVFIVLVGADVVNVMAAYQPVAQACGAPHACATGWYAAITLTTSAPTSTIKTTVVVLAKHRTAPWWWFLREPKHVGANVTVLSVLTFLRFYNSVHQLEQKKSVFAKYITFLRKCKNKRIVFGDAAFWQKVFVTQPSCNAEISVWRIVWFKTNCCLLSSMRLCVPVYYTEAKYSGPSKVEYNPFREAVQLSICSNLELNFPIRNNVNWINPFKISKIYSL